MRDNIITKMAFKNNVGFLFFNIIMTVIAIIVLNNNYVSLYNFFFGPFDISIEELDSISRLEQKYDYLDRINYILREHPLDANHYIKDNKYFFKVRGEEAYHSGVQDYEKGYVRIEGIKSNIETVATEDYLLLPVKNKLLVVRTKLGASGKEFSGIILPFFPDLSYEIEQSSGNDKIKDMLYPFILDTTGKFRNDLYFPVAICVLLILFVLINYYKIIIRFKNPLKHPLYQRLGIYGPAKEVAENILMELTDEENKYEDGLHIVTPNWIIRKGLIKPRITRNYMKKEKY